ncbi:MAG TPA: DUF445 family protein [Longimicrobiales bacterium]|nr:DUF445 family protein [Longimicrobiales bacterium]
MSDELIRVLLTVGFGALAGGTTNAIAVWMLFHPYEPPHVLGRRLNRLQGAIPKNKQRLAVAMGRTVGTKLLTPEDLARTLSEPAFRTAFDERLRAFVSSVFEEKRGSLNELLPAPAMAEVRSLMEQAGDTGLVRLDTYLASDSFRAAVERWIQLLRDELQDRPVSDVLTEERQQALAGAADRWLSEVVEGSAFADAVSEYVDGGTIRLLQPDRTFEDLLPQGLVAALERAIAGYLPIAIERLGGMLDDPAARARVEQILHELLDRFMRDLKFHQRLVAALLITPDTVDRVLKAVEKEGAAKVAELLQDPAVREAMARGVNNAIVDFLKKPVVAVLGEPGDESVENAKETVVRWITGMARDPQTRSFVVEKLHGLLDSAQGRTWGEVLRHLPPERVAEAVITAARSERAGELYRDGMVKGVDWLIHRPIGRLADKVGDDAADRAERALAEPLWRWIQEQVPTVVQKLDIAQRVEAKIMDFPTPQLEALVRGVTERELQLIIRLGYVLGAMIGMVSATIAMLF